MPSAAGSMRNPKVLRIVSSDPCISQWSAMLLLLLLHDTPAVHSLGAGGDSCALGLLLPGVRMIAPFKGPLAVRQRLPSACLPCIMLPWRQLLT